MITITIVLFKSTESLMCVPTMLYGWEQTEKFQRHHKPDKVYVMDHFLRGFILSIYSH